MHQEEYLTLDQVCKKTGVKPYVLRFWEAEFAEIKTTTNSKGIKYFSTTSLETIHLIKKLLLEDKMTIEHAKMHLHENLNLIEETTPSPQVYEHDSEKIDEVRDKLKSLVAQVQDIQRTHTWN